MKTAGIIMLSILLATASAAFLIDFYARTFRFHYDSAHPQIIFDSYAGELLVKKLVTE